MALISLANRLQSNRVDTGLIRHPGGMSPSRPSGGLASRLRNTMSPMQGAGGGFGSGLRRKLTGQPVQRPAIHPVGSFGGGAQAPGLMSPQTPELAPQAPTLGIPGASPGGDLRARLLSLLQQQPMTA